MTALQIKFNSGVKKPLWLAQNKRSLRFSYPTLILINDIVKYEVVTKFFVYLVEDLLIFLKQTLFIIS